MLQQERCALNRRSNTDTSVFVKRAVRRTHHGRNLLFTRLHAGVHHHAQALTKGGNLLPFPELCLAFLEDGLAQFIVLLLSDACSDDNNK